MENHDGGPGKVIEDIEGKERNVDLSVSLYLDMVGLFFSTSSVTFVQENRDLQRLAANEVGPCTDLGGDSLTTGQLLVHALSEELSSL